MLNRSGIPLFAARRSPVGRFGGGLRDIAPADLAVAVAASILPEALRAEVAQVIMGQVLQAGAGMNVARQVGLKLGLPLATPGYTVNMACASGLKCVALAAEAIAGGEEGLILAGGVESMSRTPHYAASLRWGHKYGSSELADAMVVDGLTDPVLGIGMGETAERIVDAHAITREDQDRFAWTSQQRAGAAAAAMAREIIPIATRGGLVAGDEHPRPDTTLERLASLRPAFRPEGSVTAGNASGINDGAALVLVGSTATGDRLGLTPLGRIVGSASVGCDPATMGLGPVFAIRKLCSQLDWRPEEVDAVEINEAFAAQALACIRLLGLDEARVNQRGGAIALGHPIGASGCRVLVTLLHLMEDCGYRRGIASLCVGGGMGIALAVTREGA